MPVVCAACKSTWVDAHYDYSAFKRAVLQGLPGRAFNIWRYHDTLPILNPQSLDLETVGGTPMYRSRRFASDLGCGQVYVKDERFGPTSSFKDRQAAVSVAAMVEAGLRETVIASTGNAAVAYAAACARAGIKLWVFMTSMVPQEKLREVALYGAEVVKVSGTYDETKAIAAEFAKRRGLWLDRGAASLPARESMKTIAYEIVEQLGWRAPEWYIQAVSGGLGPLGVYHGFEELYAMGLIDRVPKLAVIQAEGCAPMVRAFRAGQSTAEAVTPQTRIAILSTGDPGKTYTYLWKLTQKHGGTMESVTDGEAFTTMRSLAKSEGLAVEPATAVAFAGLAKLVRGGALHPDALVVVNCTGHTFPVEKHVLGDQWSIDVKIEGSKTPAVSEGLEAALERLDERTTTVLIMDDNPNDAMLVRRFLEARKNYRVFEAADGLDGLAKARERRPDLIITDLMMPNLDGFGFLEALKSDSATRDIPVIVVSAKDLTAADRARLKGNIEAIYQKGSLPPRVFVDQVVEVLEHKAAQAQPD
ncbi:MAG: threonine synthase, partial [Chloroflexota bacterium]